MLEDHIQRVVLCGSVSTNELTTGWLVGWYFYQRYHDNCFVHYLIGIVVALLGAELDNGKFLVDDVCNAGIPNQLNPSPAINDE